MPLYEYECASCGHHLEAQQKMADAPLTKCPECGKKKLQRLISATAFHLKGGGWYKDLYASAKPGADTSGGQEKSESSDKPTADKSAAAMPATGEASKPASKSESTAVSKGDTSKPGAGKKGDKGGSSSGSSGSGGGASGGSSGKRGSSASAAA